MICSRVHGHIHAYSVIETRQSKAKQLRLKTTKEELPQVGLEPVTFCVTRQTLYQLSHRGSSAGQAESLNVIQRQRHLFPDKQGNSFQYLYVYMYVHTHVHMLFISIPVATTVSEIVSLPLPFPPSPSPSLPPCPIACPTACHASGHTYTNTPHTLCYQRIILDHITAFIGGCENLFRGAARGHVVAK